MTEAGLRKNDSQTNKAQEKGRTKSGGIKMAKGRKRAQIKAELTNFAFETRKSPREKKRQPRRSKGKRRELRPRYPCPRKKKRSSRQEAVRNSFHQNNQQ